MKTLSMDTSTHLTTACRRVIALLVLAGALMAAPSAGAAGSITAFTLDSLPGDLLAQGRSYAFAPPDETVTVGHYGDGVSVYADPAGFSAFILPPTGQTLTPGTYQASWPATPTTAGLNVGGNGVGCSGTTGTVTIHEYQTDAQDEVTTFSASYRQLCDGSTQPAYGEIRFNSALDYRAAVADPAALTYGDQLATTASSEQTTTITNRGTLGITLAAGTITGANAGDFAITSDTCSGKTLAPGAVCSAGVTFTPTDSGTRSATLHFDDNTTAGGRNVVLSGKGTKLKGSVSISASTRVVTYGHRLTVTGHLQTASENRTLAIYRTPAGGSSVLVGAGTVSSDGSFSLRVKPGKNTIFKAVWDGDPTHSAATSPGVTVRVRLVMHAVARGAYATQGGYHLYRYTSRCASSGAGCPTFLVYASPRHPRAVFTLHLQRQSASGSWRTVLTASTRFSRKGTQVVRLLYRGTSLIGDRMRISFSMKNHADHLGNVSRWVRFRIV
jgi:hypothetical protein